MRTPDRSLSTRVPARRHRVPLAALAALATLPALAAPVAAQVPEPVAVFVVRHAEKGPEEPDPDLSAAGRARAQVLAQLLEHASISALFVTEFRRTRQTAEPLAARLGLELTQLDARDVAGLVARIRSLPPGTRALVVSHSNLVPAIVERLTGTAVAPLTDGDYDRMYLALAGPAGGQVVELRYGTPSR